MMSIFKMISLMSLTGEPSAERISRAEKDIRTFVEMGFDGLPEIRLNAAEALILADRTGIPLRAIRMMDSRARRSERFSEILRAGRVMKQAFLTNSGAGLIPAE